MCFGKEAAAKHDYCMLGTAPDKPGHDDCNIYPPDLHTGRGMLTARDTQTEHLASDAMDRQTDTSITIVS